MISSGQTIRIGIATYPRAQQAAVLGLKDLLQSAGRFQQAGATIPRTFQVELVDSFSPDEFKGFDTVILPPCLGARPEGKELASVVRWIARQHAQGALICSICAGAFALAETGLLNGRQATTHWALAKEFADTFPEVRLEASRLIIDDGDVVTAGGLMAWMDLGLKLVARYLGPAVMLETARYFLIDPGEREQSYYNLFAPNLTHGDAGVLKVQHWLQANFQSAVTVPQMASVARQEERTFLRRFRASTGLNPSEYLQRLRISKARERLELTTASIETIALEVGYLDVSAFRKLFQKIVGLSPREYRKRFAPAGG
ncbi:MAG: helix-turn-helix domain-containing protein [Roseibium sp.]|uniref:GlxA family transcriptional regulator n=1 Tax=Roseibium sp. TaxID=1936156 RepID=UPI0026396FC7|nr:helix-turn-helix domain-containing protein [Roseibium sp.]MCV0427596.1 helix-turn-helix domain-containing protein [Roseibium sp.]